MAKPTIESSLREAIASLRVAQELAKGQVDRAIGRDAEMDWAGLLAQVASCAMDAKDALKSHNEYCASQVNNE